MRAGRANDDAIRPTAADDDGNYALEAKDLANDEFFYKQLAKESPSLVGEPAGDDVELIEPKSTAGGRRAGEVDRGVELVHQGKRPKTQRSNDDAGKQHREEVDNHKRYVNGEQKSDDDSNEDNDDDDEEQDENDEDDDKKPRTIQYTKQFDNKDALLKEVKQIVRKNEKLTKEANGDVYWEIEYEHPKY